ncbi:hypothetical protein [Corynebacterium aquatimens]|uniref:Uncharacterized protein n=1 Tax=Corynebacterium aquatimens TaxID=1190508 RepID=A0A931DYJ8_9CORY|nr:hypothetical protein [Corynebacterium aquatimens]MBG6122480.1 hypothetical protein [Corynebacterium aquatimens]WJY64980.1 hypothetical protein CAQUA_01205 [Corynebacterium aquatimens]
MSVEGPAPVADVSAESFPDYGARLHDSYIDGYDPVSLHAPHSSLVKNITWVGMGLVLSCLAGFGTLIYGAAGSIWGHGASPDISSTVIIVGAVVTLATLILGFVFIHMGRANYRNYRSETGRRN